MSTLVDHVLFLSLVINTGAFKPSLVKVLARVVVGVPMGSFTLVDHVLLVIPITSLSGAHTRTFNKACTGVIVSIHTSTYMTLVIV